MFRVLMIFTVTDLQQLYFDSVWGRHIFLTSHILKLFGQLFNHFLSDMESAIMVLLPLNFSTVQSLFITTKSLTVTNLLHVKQLSPFLSLSTPVSIHLTLRYSV